MVLQNYKITKAQEASQAPLSQRFLHDLSWRYSNRWDSKRWPNFSIGELACRHCGESYIDCDFLDRLQALRNTLGKPLYILSAHRCTHHNAMIGGAPLSQHLKVAVDISLYNHDRFGLASQARSLGFTGFGYYSTFLHIDIGRSRHWYGGQKAKDLWQQP